MVKQVGLLAAGCQPWNTDVCAASGDRFAYCATLAIYVYQLDSQYNEFKLLSILSEHKKTITGISWHPHNPDIFASSSAENKIIVWDILKQTPIATLENTKGVPAALQWCVHQMDAVSYVCGRGPFYIWTYIGQSAMSLSTLKDTASFGSDISCFRWHPKKTEKLALGHKDGTVSFCAFNPNKYIPKHLKPQKHVLKPDNEDDVEDPVVAVEWDPLSTEYLLVANLHSGVRLIDSMSLSVIVTFSMPSAAAKVQTLSWVTSAPGMFVTGDARSGVLRIWNVSKSTPVDNIRVKKTGFHALKAICDTKNRHSEKPVTNCTPAQVSSTSVAQAPSMVTTTHFAVPPAQILCMFLDGGVGLYDIGRRKWNFLRDQGHMETIFDCRFSPTDSNILATGSFDGTIKLWDINTLNCVASSPGNEGVIYSISWAPSNINCIVAATSKLGVFIWDIGKGCITTRFGEHGRYSVFTVAWNKLDPQRIMSTGANGFCIIRLLDGTLYKRYKHPGAVYGCDWSPHNKDMLATGCDDKQVRVYYCVAGSDQPLKVFSGHTARVFHVKWSPLKESLLCSGSDDGTVRIWDYSQDSCIITLHGHTGPVRGLLWNPEVPYLVMSGSWDSSIRVWDIRDGKCLDSSRDHGADVYGLACHPSRPFLLASSSRDTTVRLWSLTSLVQPLELNILTGKPWTDILGTVDSAMTVGTPPLLTGRYSKDLKTQVEEYPGGIRNRTLKLFSKFFMVPSGTSNLWELVGVLQGQDDTLLSQDYSKGIMHVKHLTKFCASEAQQLEMAKLTKSGGGVGARSKQDRVREAANLHIKSGNIQRYCELMVELGEWERAIAVAPGVSIEYWKSLAERYTKFLIKEDNDTAVPFCTAVGNARMLADFFISRGQISDAVLTAQVACEGTFATPQGQGLGNNKGQCNGLQEPSQYDLQLLQHAVDELAESHFRNGCPVLSACCYLAVNNPQKAMSRLIQGHELELAVAMGMVLGDLQEYTTVAIELLSRRCERLGNWDLAIDLLHLVPDNFVLLAKCCSRCSASTADRDLLHKKANLPSVSECLHKAEQLRPKLDSFACVTFYLLSTSPEIGLELGVEYIKSKIKSGSWTTADVFDMLQLLGCIQTSILSTHTLKNELLALSAYIGALVAIQRGSLNIVQGLLDLSSTLLKQDIHMDIGIQPSVIEKEITVWLATQTLRKQGLVDLNSVSPEYRPIYVNLLEKAGDKNSPAWMGPDCVASSHLPSHSDIHLSCLTAERIQGQPYFLEDRITAMSLNEALMWAKVNPFSPLGSCFKINPF